MPADFAALFAVLKPVLGKYAKRLSVKPDTPIEYTPISKSASRFAQHKGQQLFFGSVRLGKAYVSFHLMPLYMCPALAQEISPALKKLKKRMQGKTCFNFKTVPSPDPIAGLEHLTEAGFQQWREDKWL